MKLGDLVVREALDKLLLDTPNIVACEICLLLKTLVTIVLKHGVSDISDGTRGAPFASVVRSVACVRVEMAVGASVTETVIPYCKQNTVFASTKVRSSTENSY